VMWENQTILQLGVHLDSINYGIAWNYSNSSWTNITSNITNTGILYGNNESIIYWSINKNASTVENLVNGTYDFNFTSPYYFDSDYLMNNKSNTKFNIFKLSIICIYNSTTNTTTGLIN